MPPVEKLKLIGVVGPCASGKTTLVNSLSARGYQARHIAQEHSYVLDMWARITHPDVLIFLDASYPATVRRRQLTWTIQEYEEQQQRLRHARQHADLYLFTDPLKPDEIVDRVLAFVEGFKR